MLYLFIYPAVTTSHNLLFFNWRIRDKAKIKKKQGKKLTTLGNMMYI